MLRGEQGSACESWEILVHTKWHYATNYLLVLVSPTAQSFSRLDQSELGSSCLSSGGLSWQLAIDFLALYFLRLKLESVMQHRVQVFCLSFSYTHTHSHLNQERDFVKRQGNETRVAGCDQSTQERR